MPDPIQIVPRWFTVQLTVYPPIPLISANALELAKNLATKLSLTDIHMSDELWEYTHPAATEVQPYGRVRVTVEEDKIKIDHMFPATGLEHFERLIQTVIEAIEPTRVSPQFTITTVELDYVVDLKQDARQALLVGLGLLNEDEDEAHRIDCFGRPCHLVGLRLGFPPYRIKRKKAEPVEGEAGDEHNAEDKTRAESGESDSEENETEPGEDWMARLTVTTLEDDPAKASVEVFGQWGPSPWTNIHETLIERLNIAERFLREKAVTFLGNFRAEDDHEDHK